MKVLIWILGISALLTACNSKPKVVVAEENTPAMEHTTANEGSLTQATKIDPPPGGISLAELIANKAKYEGQTVKVKGKCVKINKAIMDRNWVHLQDGSLNDGTDLTVTTKDNVALGDVVAFEGKITLNKDFGAGYTYEIIMEDAHLLQ